MRACMAQRRAAGRGTHTRCTYPASHKPAGTTRHRSAWPAMTWPVAQQRPLPATHGKNTERPCSKKTPDNTF